MPRSNRDMVAWCLMILWPKPFRFHDFFYLQRWDTHCGEIDELKHRLRKTKAIQSLLQGGMTWTRDTARYVLRSVALQTAGLVSPNGRNVAMKWLWLPGPRMKSVDEHALHGFRGILLQSWSWCASPEDPCQMRAQCPMKIFAEIGKEHETWWETYLLSWP